MNDVSDRLSKLEGASSFLATKEDIALVKGAIEKISTNLERSINSLLWKLLGGVNRCWSPRFRGPKVSAIGGPTVSAEPL